MTARLYIFPTPPRSTPMTPETELGAAPIEVSALRATNARLAEALADEEAKNAELRFERSVMIQTLAELGCEPCQVCGRLCVEERLVRVEANVGFETFCDSCFVGERK